MYVPSAIFSKPTIAKTCVKGIYILNIIIPYMHLLFLNFHNTKSYLLHKRLYYLGHNPLMFKAIIIGI